MISSRFLPLVRCAAIALCFSAPIPRVQAAPSAVCPNQLPNEIEAIVTRPNFARSRFGILVQPLGNRDTLYGRDANRFFIPASNVKLFTTAAALKKLSPAYRFRTSVYGTTTPNGWRIRLVGRGDPSLTDAQLKDLVQQLKRRGVRAIAQLTIDDSYFDSDFLPEDWAVGDVKAAYGAPINSAILNQNSLGLRLFPQALGQPLRVEWDDPTERDRWQIKNESITVDQKATEFVQVERGLKQTITVAGQLRVGSDSAPAAIAVLDPAETFLSRFQAILRSEQITVAQAQAIREKPPTDGIEIARIDSPPLSTLVNEANTNSNNLYAEALLRAIGAQSAKAPGRTVLERGLLTVSDVLKPLGVDTTAIVSVDGSGLARQNMATPEALVQVLQAMAQQPEGKLYRSSFAIAGVSGTLQNRFQNSPAKGITQAKTGTLTGIAALSGYINPPNYSPLVFSIIVNQSPDAAAVQRGAIDEIVGILARLRSCP